MIRCSFALAMRERSMRLGSRPLRPVHLRLVSSSPDMCGCQALPLSIVHRWRIVQVSCEQRGKVFDKDL